MIEFPEDTWSIVETTSTGNDIHPNREIDFNLYTDRFFWRRSITSRQESTY